MCFVCVYNIYNRIKWFKINYNEYIIWVYNLFNNVWQIKLMYGKYNFEWILGW